MSKKIALAVALFGMLSIHQATFAEDAPKAAPNKQQNKMAECNKNAGEKALKGDERKAFMSDCLKNKPEKPATQQDKMKTCNKDAGEKQLKGDERKKFMSDCLKGSIK